MQAYTLTRSLTMPTQRPATEADLRQLWTLRTRAVRLGCATHYPPDIIATWCAAPPPAEMPLLVRAGGGIIAEEGGQALGYAILDLDTGEVDAVFVDPARQGSGIGQALLRTLEAMARERGLATMFLSASLNAVAFYERAGFRALRERMCSHRSGIAIRSVLMEKRLGPVMPASE
jgi:ribosomal protein S18 acetylase RimI-like enzyme